jgi:phage head maturation protease
VSDYDAYIERALASRSKREPKEKTPDPPPAKPAVPFKWPASGLALQGFACLYNVRHEFRGGTDIFLPNCFAGSLYDVLYGCDHRYEQPKLGTQESGTLELAETDVGLAFRLAIQPGHIELLDGRDQVSVAYVPHDVIVRDGIRIIRKALLFEISSVYIGAMPTTHAVIVEKKLTRSLADDAKHGFACESAAVGFMRALKRLQ